MIQPIARGRTLVLFLVSMTVVFSVRETRAQMGTAGSGRNLGGYGGSITNAGSGMSMSGPAIPYAGRYGGFMPSRMSSGAGDISFSTRNTSSMGSSRTTISLSPMTNRMTTMNGGMDQGFGVRASDFQNSFGLRGGMFQPMDGKRGMRVMPPSFGYPFRQPPSLMSNAFPGMGMGM